MPQFRNRRRNLIAALAVAGPVLAGCSSVPSMPSSFSSMFGSSTAAGNSNASAAVEPPPNFECPGVTIRRGASTLTSSANPSEPTPMNLRYQVSIGNTARECRLVGGMVSLKVGMQGRVVLGPQGGPGQVDVPLRFAVVQEGVNPKTIATKFERIAVTVPPDDSNVLFSHVEEGLEFPMPKGNAIDAYVIYIGFDPVGLQNLERKRPAPKSARPRRPS